MINRYRTMDDTNGDINYEEVLELLATSRKACSALKAAFGPEEGKAAVSIFRSGDLDCETGHKIYDFFHDEISDESKMVWSRSLAEYDSYDSEEVYYPLEAMQYATVFWVAGPEGERFGYFSSKKLAVEFVYSNWENVI